MLPFKQFRSNLESDLQSLGLNSGDANLLSEARISEETYAPAQNLEESSSLEYSQGESPYVGQELLDRIEALVDTENLTVEDAENIIEGLMAKAPESGCENQYEEIIESLSLVGDDLSEDVDGVEGNLEEALSTILESANAGELSPVECFRIMSSLIDAPLEEGLEDLRDEIIEAVAMNEGFRKMLKNIGGKVKRIIVKKFTSAQKAKARQRNRKRKAKEKIAREKRERSAKGKKNATLMQRARKLFRMESSELADRLKTRALAESRSFNDEFKMIDRVGRVFNELSYFMQDDVVEVMAEQFEILTSSLCESQSDLENALRPCIAIIAECMKEIEQGNC